MNVMELFSCSGGFAEGLRRAGLPVTMAFDHDPDACASYEQNLGHAPVRLDARDLLRMMQDGWRPAPIDLLLADPPCTPWSRAGNRLGQADDRDMLAVTVEIVRVLRPRAALIANVPGLDDAPNWPTVQKTIGSLPYCIDFARLDAADVGVPQHRVRPFWYLHAKGSPHIVWPERTHGSPDECAHPTLLGRPLKPWVTCRQALAHLSPEELGTPVRLRWRGANGHQIASVPDAPARVVGTSSLSDGNVLAHPDDAFRDKRGHLHPGKKARASALDEPAHVVTTRCNGDGTTLIDGPNHRVSTPDAPARTLTSNTHGDGALIVLSKHPPFDLDAPATTIRGADKQKAQLLAGELLVNDRHPIHTLDAQSFTVTSKGDGRGAQGACVLAYDGHPISRADEPGHVVPSSQPGNGGAVIEWLASDNRGQGPNAIKLSEKAAAILQGFPPGWRFVGKTKRARWAMIGQAMPAPLAEAVGRSIRVALSAAEIRARRAGGAP